MKTFTDFSRERSITTPKLIVSVLNNPIISLDEEKILRQANKLAIQSNIKHLSLIIQSPVNETELIKKYVSRFSSSHKYFKSLKEVKQSLKDIPVQIICDEQTGKSFQNPVLIETRSINLAESSASGNIEKFRFGALNDLREIDCKFLMNVHRSSIGLSEIKDKIEIESEPIRERYIKGEIFQIGETVIHQDKKHEILDRGSNYLTLVSESGAVKKAWLQDIQESDSSIEWDDIIQGQQVSFKGFVTIGFDRISEDTKNVFINLIKESSDPLLALKTIRMMDEFIFTEKPELKEKVQESISKLKSLEEDLESADYKTDKNGRRYRARKIVFQDKIKEELDTKLEYHEILNPKLWDENDELLQPVKEKLKEIGEAFESYLDKDGKIFEVVDFIVTGSNCNYNYTPQSDIDLHLVINLDDFEDKELIGAFMTAKKTLWNNQYDIKIKGYDVELYAQDKNETLVATGIYSLKQDKWIIKPVHQRLGIDNFSVQTKACDIINQIDHVLNGHGTVEDVDGIKEKIRKMRKSGLSQGGEFSVENLVFKALRNNGYFEKLNNFKQKALDKELSLENQGGVVADTSRTDNFSSGIMNQSDFLRLVRKMKSDVKIKPDGNHLRLMKIKNIHD